jgi:hypothetical protein
MRESMAKQLPARSALCATLVVSAGIAAAAPVPAGADAWQKSALSAVRGITVGPIESALHPDKGYGTETCRLGMQEARRLGANWVSITPFGRVWDLAPTGISMSFEQPFVKNRADVIRAIEQAHAEGLRVLVVPHLWVESGGWRGEINPGDNQAWQRWAEAYRGFLLEWAEVARESRAEMLAVGVELRTWVTTSRAPSFIDIVRAVRGVYPGLLTYAANWDDVEQTVIWGELDVIGINAFYPLAEKPGVNLEQLLEGGERVRERGETLAKAWNKPVLFTEFGYTTRSDPALRPWEWPEHLSDVRVDELAQADAYRALLAPLVDQTWFAGFFVWRLFSDPDDVSQEPLWGFSPRGKLAELVLRSAFASSWAADGIRLSEPALISDTRRSIGIY